MKGTGDIRTPTRELLLKLTAAIVPTFLLGLSWLGDRVGGAIERIRRHRVELTGGRLTVDSTVGVGTRFRPGLPLREAPGVPEPATMPQPTPRPPSDWAAGLDVLVVDDNATNRFLLERYFSDSGACLRAAGNGAEAVALYSERRADLVLLDLAMPVMDGNQAARRLRALEVERGWPAATLVALTANAAPAAREAASEAGMNAFLEKPLRRRALVAFVRDHVTAAVA